MRVQKTSQYDRWFRKLKDSIARAKINARIRRIQLVGELVGDWKSVGEKVIELRIDYGPGYRVYVYMEREELLLLLIGGNKSSQQADIKQAKSLLKEWRQENGYQSN